MQKITVIKQDHSGMETWRYEGQVLAREDGEITIEALFNKDDTPFYEISLLRGDRFVETYYADRWYNIFEVWSAEDTLKGWYCNITRPALMADDVVTSEDLELDLFVAPDRRYLLRLDREEFDALALDVREPEAHAAALKALHELEDMARRGAPPQSEGTMAQTANRVQNAKLRAARRRRAEASRARGSLTENEFTTACARILRPL